MPKARSYKNQPWTGFEKQSFSLLKDDFVHEKLLTVKANVESNKGGVNLKETLTQKGEGLTSTGQTKLWFFFKNNQSVYAKILPKVLTVSYDHGVQQKNNKNFNWYGAFDTQRSISNNAIRVGVDIFDKEGKWDCNNMLQFNQEEKSALWFHKAYTVKNQWTFNYYHTINLTKKTFDQAALLFAYKKAGQKNSEYFARFELPSFSNVKELQRSALENNKLTLNWISSQKNKSAHGIEFSSKLNEIYGSPSDLVKKFTTAFEFKYPEQTSTFKLRFGGDLTTAFSVKNNFGSYGTYIWGAELSELGTKNKVKFGIQIDLNL